MLTNSDPNHSKSYLKTSRMLVLKTFFAKLTQVQERSFYSPLPLQRLKRFSRNFFHGSVTVPTCLHTSISSNIFNFNVQRPMNLTRLENNGFKYRYLKLKIFFTIT